MAHEQLTYDDLLRIVELIKSTEHFSEFRLKVGDIELELRHRKSSAPTAGPPLVAAARIEPAVAKPIERAPTISTAATTTWPEDSIVVRSPMIGTFYCAPSPGAPPFVAVGQAVKPDDIIGIIEVMKLMNSIPAEVHGTVAQILVTDAATVEAGQPLIVIQPN